MQELLISTFDIACIADSLMLGARESSGLKKAIWDNEKDFLYLEEETNYRKWLYDIQHWTDYLYDKPALDAEFPKIQRDIEAQGSELYEEDYLSDDFDIDLFFKSMRLRLLYLNKRGFERMKLRTLLSAYGYKRRSPYIVGYVKKCLYFYHIQTYTRGNVVCDIEEIGLDEMMTLRVINADVRRSVCETDSFDDIGEDESELCEWKEINNKEFSYEFCNKAESIMSLFKYLGMRKWGDGGGYTMELPTYELATDSGEKVWCATVEFVNYNTGVPNRRGIIATFPISQNQTLGQTMATVIPYEYSRRFNTLAFCCGDHYEIRNYGKITVGRAGVSREDFFNYLKELYPGIACEDDDGQKYFKVYEFDGELTKSQFAKQTYDATKLLSELKIAIVNRQKPEGRTKSHMDYVVDGDVIERMAEDLCKVGNLEFDVSGCQVVCKKGIASSINNQQGNQIKVSSPRSLSSEEREVIRDEIIEMLGENGMKADKKNRIKFGMYDIPSAQFINTNAEKFIKDLLTIGICKNREMFAI